MLLLYNIKSEVSKLCKCNTCCYFKTAVIEFALHHTEAKTAGWRSEDTLLSVRAEA